MSAPIDYSRCPLWWWCVCIAEKSNALSLRYVRAADWEEAKRRGLVIARDLGAPRFGDSLEVRPQMERSGPRRQAFAGYGDE